MLLRNPKTTRPWQHVLEPLSEYLHLGAELSRAPTNLHGESFNFGPLSNQDISVEQLVTLLQSYWNQLGHNHQISSELPERDDLSPRESTLLKLVCDKAYNIIQWKPILPIELATKMTAEWYDIFYKNGSCDELKNFTSSQVDFYTKLARENKLTWTA